jgi:hypothetical protein
MGWSNEDALLAFPTSLRQAGWVSPETAFATRDDLYAVRDELRSEIRHLSDRLDRMQLTLVAGFMSMVVALIVVSIFG